MNNDKKQKENEIPALNKGDVSGSALHEGLVE